MSQTRLTALPVRGIRKELQDLYSRRSNIDALIQSLEEYGRFRALHMERSHKAGRPTRHFLRIA
jgi:hypothetical protein